MPHHIIVCVCSGVYSYISKYWMLLFDRPPHRPWVHFHLFSFLYLLIFIHSLCLCSFQNLLISDQSSVIIKSLSKLPKFFDIVVYPTLLTITCDNDGAKNVIGKEFDMKVIYFLFHILIGFCDELVCCCLFFRIFIYQCFDNHLWFFSMIKLNGLCFYFLNFIAHWWLFEDGRGQEK